MSRFEKASFPLTKNSATAVEFSVVFANDDIVTSPSWVGVVLAGTLFQLYASAVFEILK